MKKLEDNFSRQFGRKITQHIQNIVIRQYCETMNLHYILSSTEYSMENSSLILIK